jgi:hypothetical protein
VISKILLHSSHSRGVPNLVYSALFIFIIIIIIGTDITNLLILKKGQPTKMTSVGGYCLCRYSLFDNSISMKTDIAILVLWLDDIITGKLFSMTSHILRTICTIEYMTH